MSSPAEREQIESEYFENEDAFAEMLAAEDDLIDAYARGELAGIERQRFEKFLVTLLRQRDRVQFARAFGRVVSARRSVETKPSIELFDIFKTFRSPRFLRTATIAAVFIIVAMLAWLVIDRRRMANEFRELHAESVELRKRTEALQLRSDTERVHAVEVATQLADLRDQADKLRHRESSTTSQRARHLPEVRNSREKITSNKPTQAENFISTQAALGNTFDRGKMTEFPHEARDVAGPLILKPATTREGNVVGGRADQVGATLDGVDVVEPRNIDSLMPRNMSGGGGIIFRGTVRHPSGKLVSGATVTLTDPARNFTRTKLTSQDGAYIFNAVPPGMYSLEVQAPGFKRALASDFGLLVDNPTVRDMQLEIGDVSETVNVTSAAEASINTHDASLGNSFERKRITELPLNANNVVGLLSLQPGITRTGSVNGARADQSNTKLKGVDAATIRIPNSLTWIRFQIALQPSAIQEDYRVTLETADGHPITSVSWIEPLTPNQTILETPVISTGDLPSGNYVLLLMGRASTGSFVKVAEYLFKVIRD